MSRSSINEHMQICDFEALGIPGPVQKIQYSTADNAKHIILNYDVHTARAREKILGAISRCAENYVFEKPSSNMHNPNLGDLRTPGELKLCPRPGYTCTNVISSVLMALHQEKIIGDEDIKRVAKDLNVTQWGIQIARNPKNAAAPGRE